MQPEARTQLTPAEMLALARANIAAEEAYLASPAPRPRNMLVAYAVKIALNGQRRP